MSTKLAIVLVLCALFSVISSAPAPSATGEIYVFFKNPKIVQKGAQFVRTVVNGVKPGVAATENLVKQGIEDKNLVLGNKVANLAAAKNPAKVEEGLKLYRGSESTRPALDQIPHMA